VRVVCYTDGAVGIPLLSRTGEINHWTFIEAEDLEVVSGYQWRVGPRGKYVSGRVAGRRGPSVYMHRLLLGVTDPLLEVDHKDGDHFNNRRSNLRAVTRSQNQQNKRKINGSSRFRGVYWDRARSKWHAQATLNGKAHNLGRYDTEEEAGAAALAFRNEHFVEGRQCM
jgi:hypothetical protein